MPIYLNTSHVKSIEQSARGSFPNECCGFLLGTLNEDSREVVEVVPATNSGQEGEQYHRFLITPDDYRRCEKVAREKEMDILGFFHSHPNAKARPSKYDLDHAWPWYSYIIVSLIENEVKDMTSWVLAEDRDKFHEQEIKIT